MKRVVARGEKPNIFPLGKLAETNGAISSNLSINASFVILPNGDLVNDTVIEPVGRRHVPCCRVLRSGIGWLVCRAALAAAEGHAGAGVAVPGDDSIVGDQQEGGCKNANDGDDERREDGGGGGVGISAGRGEGRRRREEEVTPLGAVDAAESLGAILGRHIWHPCGSLVCACHGTEEEDQCQFNGSISFWVTGEALR